MKTPKSLFAIIIIALFIPILTAGIFGNDQSAGGYLKNSSYGNFVDTVATASTNDTTATFTNPDNYKFICVEYKQNSASSYFTLNNTSISNLRLLYNASDSSFYVQSLGQSQIGWITQPVLIQTSLTPASKVTVTLKTGVGVVAFRGYN